MSSHTASLSACEARLEYHFRNSDLLRSALTHSSSATVRADSNERMEFLGDAVLGLVVCHELYDRLPAAMEGDLTKIKSAVVSRRICARVAERLRLTDSLILGQGMDLGDPLPRSLAAATLEAVIAAIFLDGGLDPARTFILANMGSELDAACASQHQFNYKSQLQQYAQRELGGSPQYEVLDEKGPDHAKCFEVAVIVRGRQLSVAWGPSKKEAEQIAALRALRAAGLIEARDESDEENDGDSLSY